MVFKLTSNLSRLAGTLLLVIDSFISYERSDIITEIFGGRSLEELDIGKLMLPVILLVIGLYLLRKGKNKKHEEILD